MPRARSIVLLYVACYLVATLADAATTAAAMRAGGGELNPHVASAAGTIDWSAFVLVNVAVLAVTAGMLAWAWQRRDRIDPAQLAAPWRGLYSWATYLNPFAARAVPKSALHYAAAAPALVACKLLVALNNLLIALGLPDLVTPLATWLMSQFDGALAYWSVIFLLWQPFWAGGLYLTAALLRRERDTMPKARIALPA